MWEGAGDRTELKYFDPHSYSRQRCVFLVLLMLNRRPWGPLCWVLTFFTASYQHLLWTPIQSGLPRAPSAGCGFPYNISSISVSNTNSTALTSVLTELYNSSTSTRSLKSHVDRHQAEITVMQFTGHSLPVRQSMSVPWEFFTSSHFISQFPPTQFPLNCH